MLGVRSLQRKVTQQMIVTGSPLKVSGTESLSVALVVNAFVPSVDTLIGDLTFVTGDGMDPLDSDLGEAPLVGFDPATQEGILTVQDPAGGWTWTLTADQTPPVVVFGYALFIAGTPDVLFATALLDAPFTFTTIGDQLHIGVVRMTLPAFPLS